MDLWQQPRSCAAYPRTPPASDDDGAGGLQSFRHAMDPPDAGTDPTNRSAIHLRSLERATHICAATMQSERKDLPEIL